MFSEMRTASVEASILYLQDDQQSQVNISGNVKSQIAALEAGCLERFQSLNVRHLKGKVRSEKSQSERVE